MGRKKGNGETKEQILRAATQVFARRGYAATVDEIAAAAGVTKGSVYHYFRSKQEILFELYRYALDVLFRALAAIATRTDKPPDERLREVIRHHIATVCEERALMTVFTELRRELSPSQWREIVRHRDAYEELLNRLIEEGVQEGYFRPVEVPVVTKAILGSINWIHLWYRPDGRLAKEEIAAEIADFLVAGLRRWHIEGHRSAREIRAGEKVSLALTLGAEHAERPPNAELQIPYFMVQPLAELLAGPGSLVKELSFSQRKSVQAGETLVLTLEVDGAEPGGKSVRCRLYWRERSGETVAEGRATVVPTTGRL